MIKYIRRKSKNESPMLKAIRFAENNGFVLSREPFGKRGSLIEIYKNGRMVGYRKSYQAALNFMCRERN
jgi:hypothetical protein